MLYFSFGVHHIYFSHVLSIWNRFSQKFIVFNYFAPKFWSLCSDIVRLAINLSASFFFRFCSYFFCIRFKVIWIDLAENRYFSNSIIIERLRCDCYVLGARSQTSSPPFFGGPYPHDPSPQFLKTSTQICQSLTDVIARL